MRRAGAGAGEGVHEGNIRKVIGLVRREKAVCKGMRFNLERK